MTRGIGLFGGTFDPPHLGHVALATEARYQLGLETVLFVVANDPWQKSAIGEITPAPRRFEMVRLALRGHDGLVASDVEIRRGGPSYTIDTVEQLAEEGTELTFLMGADTASGLDTWHRADELRDRIRIGLAERHGIDAGSAPSGWRTSGFQMPVLEISSTEIRRRCEVGAPIHHLVAPAVAALIAGSGLYGLGG